MLTVFEVDNVEGAIPYFLKDSNIQPKKLLSDNYFDVPNTKYKTKVSLKVE